MEQFEASIVNYHKALELVDKYPEDINEKHIMQGKIMHNMALGYDNLNNHKEAIEWCKKSLDVRQKLQNSPTKNYTIASTLNSIGTCYQHLGEFQKALEYFEKAREKLKEDDQETKRLKSFLFNNEGICHKGLGNYEKALEVQGVS